MVASDPAANCNEDSFHSSLEKHQAAETQQLLYYNALTNIFSRTCSIVDTGEIGRIALEEVKDVVNYQRAYILLIQGDSCVPIAIYGKISPLRIERVFSEDRLAQRIIQSKKPLILSNRTEPKYSSDWELLIDSQGIMSWAGIPMVYGEEVLGLIVLEQDISGCFGQDLEVFFALLGHQVASTVRNGQLIQGLNLLQHITDKMISHLNLESILRSILQGALSLANADSGVVYLLDENEEMILRSVEIPEGLNPIPRLGNKQGITQTIINTKDLIVVNNTAENDRINPLILQRGVRSLAGIPLLSESQVIGVLYLNANNPNQFSGYLVSLLRTLAQHAAISLHNIRLVERAQHRAKSLQLLSEISRQVNSQLELDATLTSIVMGAMGLTGANSGVIHFLDKNALAIVRSVEVPTGFNHPIPRLNDENAMTRTIIRTKQPLVVPNVGQEPRVSDVIVSKGIDSLIGLPLLLQGTVVGVLYLYSNELLNFASDDQDLLMTLAEQAAIAVGKAQLLEERNQLYEQAKEQVIELKNAQSEIADKERTLVTGSLALDFIHTVNNLAGPIVPWVDLVKRELSRTNQVNEKVIAYLDKIIRDTKLILQEANALRKPVTISKIVNIEDLLGSIVGQIETIAPVGVDIVFKPEFRNPRIRVSEVLLNTALYCVIHNAVKAVGEHGQIVIRLGYEQGTKGERHIQIDISDTGCGIPTELQERIFEYGATYWADRQGTGYGLWRARSLLRGLGGNIVLKSSSEEGTTFVISLPFPKSYSLHWTVQDTNQPRSIYYRDGTVFTHPPVETGFTTEAPYFDEEPLGYYGDNEIYESPPWWSGVSPVGRYEKGVIYDCPTSEVKQPVGHYKDGNIYKMISNRQSSLVGHYDGPDDGAAAAAKLAHLV